MMSQHPLPAKSVMLLPYPLLAIYSIEGFPQSPFRMLGPLLRMVLTFNLVRFHQEAPSVTCPSSQNVASETPVLPWLLGTCGLYVGVDVTGFVT